MVEEAKTPETLDLLKVRMAKAVADGNDADVVAISKLILKQKSEVEKAEATRLQAVHLETSYQQRDRR